MPIINVEKLAQIAEIEFSDIVEDVSISMNNLRIFLKEKSFIDIWYSSVNEGRYAYHWERKNIDGSIYRHNNAPHKKWENVATFPAHFHNGDEYMVEDSKIPSIPEDAVRYFLGFVKRKIEKI